MNRCGSELIFLLALIVPVFANASSPYQSALITRMRMVRCTEPPRHGGFVMDFFVGSGPATPMGPAECPEYEIETARVFYRIRPRRDVLLPVGEEIRFRIHKRDILVLTEDADKELIFSVVEMTLRSKHENQAATPARERESEPHSRKCLTMEGEVVACGKSESEDK